ncbi:hypothetical protein D3H55_22830 [Bacillus salacetis]|uniref:Uncharacterized protein n=1 Tax=Bacillus salacetis TaxID=2315464 RepID=A0A3A1QSL1_9BACI|nr:hypothetical protein [Bacillus salacetis]RIW27627.1 hypothetical protein D3H55_22830 [Bacillus salacetis]
METADLRIEIELGDIGGGIADSPKGLPSNFEEIEVEEVIWDEDELIEMNSIVTITGYLNEKIEVVIKWNEQFYEKYKANEKVKQLIEEGEKIIVESLVSMANMD